MSKGDPCLNAGVFSLPSKPVSPDSSATFPPGNSFQTWQFYDQQYWLWAAGGNATILLVILILMLIGALPTWGYSRGWGYGPGGIVGVLLIVVVAIVLALTGQI